MVAERKMGLLPGRRLPDNEQDRCGRRRQGVVTSTPRMRLES